MPTLQAVDLNNFESVADSSAGQRSQSGEFAHAVGELRGMPHKSPLRGYFALGSLFAISGLGYAGFLWIFDQLVTLANS